MLSLRTLRSSAYLCVKGYLNAEAAEGRRVGREIKLRPHLFVAHLAGAGLGAAAVN